MTLTYDSPAGTPSKGVLTVDAPIPKYSNYNVGSANCGTLNISTTPSCTISRSSSGDIIWTITPGIKANSNVVLHFSVSVSKVSDPYNYTIYETASWYYTGDY